MNEEPELIDCPDCEGLGYFLGQKNKQFPCLLCDGEGRISPDDVSTEEERRVTVRHGDVL